MRKKRSMRNQAENGATETRSPTNGPKGLQPGDYAMAQRLIDTGVETAAASGGLQYLGEVDGRSWLLVIERRNGRQRLLALDRFE